MTAEPIQPAKPPSDPVPPPGLFAVLTMTIVWYAAIVGHFLLCGVCAYKLGDPMDLPAWLKPLDELFTYGISGFLALVLIVVWWLVVAVAFLPFAAVAYYVGRAIHWATTDRETKIKADAQFWLALGVLTPLLIMSLLSLLILPMQAPHHIDSESGLELADQVSYAAFAEYQFLSMFAMFVILVLFGTLFGGAGLVATYIPDSGMVVFFMLIFVSIAASMATGLLLGPLVLELPTQVGVYRATALAFAALGLITGVPVLEMQRSRK